MVNLFCKTTEYVVFLLGRSQSITLLLCSINPISCYIMYFQIVKYMDARGPSFMALPHDRSQKTVRRTTIQDKGNLTAQLLSKSLDSEEWDISPLNTLYSYALVYVLQVVNRISEQIVEELYFDQTSDAVSRGIIGLCSDASAGLFYAYDQNSIFQVQYRHFLNLI